MKCIKPGNQSSTPKKHKIIFLTIILFESWPINSLIEFGFGKMFNDPNGPAKVLKGSINIHVIKKGLDVLFDIRL